MKVPAILVLTTGCFLASISGLRAEVREWTRASDGKKISAEFAGMKDETTVKIKMANGQIFEVPMASLSPDDQVFLKNQKTAMAGGDKPGGGPAPEGTPKGGGTAALPEGEVTVTLSKVHLCCGDCEDAVGKIGENDRYPIGPGVTFTADRKNESIVVKAPSGKDAQAALRAIVGAGFYGVSDNSAVAIAELKEDDFTSDTMVIRDTHLCCGGCVRAFKKAVESVDGVEGCEAKAGSARVEVAGKGFKPYEVMKALREAGFGGVFQ